MRPPLPLVLLCAGLAGCTSLALSRAHQDVAWDDASQERIQVWLRAGSLGTGQPWLFLGEVLATPILIPVETWMAIHIGTSEHVRLSGGPFGWLLSLLPGFTCVPLTEHPGVFLPLHTPLHLPAAERERLRALSPSSSVDWLTGHYALAFPEQDGLPERARALVADVELVPAAPGQRAP